MNLPVHLAKYDGEISSLLKFLLVDLVDIDISCVAIFGSATQYSLFIDGVSDIDIVAFTNFTKHPNEICEYIKKFNLDFLDKEPLWYHDKVVERVEFFLKVNEITFDINIFNTSNMLYTLLDLEGSKKTVMHDSIEAIVGAIYMRSHILFGVLPSFDQIANSYFPFYSDEYRFPRMFDLKKRIEKILIKVNSTNISNDFIEQVAILRKYLFRYIFISNKVYPLNPEKNYIWQMTNFLNNCDEVLNVFLFDDKHNLSDNIAKIHNSVLQIISSATFEI